MSQVATPRLAGCGDEENPLTDSYSGTARATAAGQSLVVQLAATLSQSGDLRKHVLQNRISGRC